MTKPSDIPPDVAHKLIACRDAILGGNQDEAWHQLYSIADPDFISYTPWSVLEEQAKKHTP
jgi:hypothetical protein